jgi:hypothetical protein
LRFTSALVLVCFLLVPVIANAERVDPYLVTVEVSDRSAAARRPALRRALSEVLVGLSGQASLVMAVKSRSGLPFRDQWVQQFRYLDGPESEGSPPKLLLEARFNSKMVSELADQLGLPKWPLERGVTLMWVALDSGVHRELLGAVPEHQEISEAALMVAANRKLPLLMPLLDLDDLRLVNFSDVWGGFADQVSLASARYAAQYLMLGRVYQTRGGWGGQWQVRDGQWVDRWAFEGSDEKAVVAAAIEHVAEWLGQRYSVFASTEIDQVLVMRLEGVSDIGDYARVLRYLGGLSVIEAVAPLRVTPEILEVSIESTAGLEAIRQALAIEQVLAQVEVGWQTRTTGIALHYRLNP